MMLPVNAARIVWYTVNPCQVKRGSTHDPEHDRCTSCVVLLSPARVQSTPMTKPVEVWYPSHRPRPANTGIPENSVSQLRARVLQTLLYFVNESLRLAAHAVLPRNGHRLQRLAAPTQPGVYLPQPLSAMVHFSHSAETKVAARHSYTITHVVHAARQWRPFHSEPWAHAAKRRRTQGRSFFYVALAHGVSAVSECGAPLLPLSYGCRQPAGCVAAQGCPGHAAAQTIWACGSEPKKRSPRRDGPCAATPTAGASMAGLTGAPWTSPRRGAALPQFLTTRDDGNSITCGILAVATQERENPAGAQLPSARRPGWPRVCMELRLSARSGRLGAKRSLGERAHPFAQMGRRSTGRPLPRPDRAGPSESSPPVADASVPQLKGPLAGSRPPSLLRPCAGPPAVGAGPGTRRRAARRGRPSRGSPHATCRPSQARPPSAACPARPHGARPAAAAGAAHRQWRGAAPAPQSSIRPAGQPAAPASARACAAPWPPGPGRQGTGRATLALWWSWPSRRTGSQATPQALCDASRSPRRRPI
eukprot:scaffold1504_cov417-Prasinococcus_capsulatus_cf.AAC.56